MPSNPSRIPFFELGRPYEAEIGFSAFGLCRDGDITVTGSVLDSNNEEVPSEWRIADDRPGLALLRFTPISEGAHHFTAQFNPNVAVVQGELFSATRNQRPLAGELALPLEVHGFCDSAHILPSGALACVAEFGNGALLQLVSGGRLAAWKQSNESSARVQLGGSAIWMQTSDLAFERLVEGDGGLVTTHSVFAPAGVKLIAATDTTAFVTDFTPSMSDGGGGVVNAFRYDVDGGGLERLPLGFRVPDSATGGGMTPDAGAWWSTGATACLNPLWPGDAGPRCWAGAPSGRVDAPGLWRPGTAAAMSTSIELQREDGTTVSGPNPGRPSGNFPFMWLFGDGGDVSMMVPTDAGLVFETFGEQYTSGAADGDKLLLFQPGKASVFSR